MANVLIVAYLLIVLALIAVILLQRSEGGGLGIGGGNAGFMTVRGSANLLTRTTAILATLFFATAIGLTILSELDRGTSGILERAADAVGEGAGAETPTTVLDALNALGGTSGADESLALPSTGSTTDTTAPATTETPAAPATTAPAAETAPATDTAPASDPGLALPSTEAPATTTPEAPAN